MSNFDTRLLMDSLNSWRKAYNSQDHRYDDMRVLTVLWTVEVAKIIERLMQVLLYPTAEWVFDVYTKTNWDDAENRLVTLLNTKSLTEAVEFAEAVAAERKETLYVVDSNTGEVLFAVFFDDPSLPYARVVPGVVR